jgi:lipid-A-disaccharide synthase
LTTESLKQELSAKKHSILVVVGDLSADKHTAELITALKELNPNFHIWGLGSENMARAGAEILYDCQAFSAIGIVSAFKQVPFLANMRQILLKEIDNRRPDAVLLVDYGGFNLEFAKAISAKHKNLSVLYFISPQVWGSRPWRVRTIARAVDKMFVIFPFEEQIYAKHGVTAKFVGHPLTSNLPAKEMLLSRDQFCQKYELDPKQELVGIFPGSRRGEIKTLLPVILQAITWLHKLRPNLQFVLSSANEELGQTMYKSIEKVTTARPKLATALKVIDKVDSYSLMAVSDLLWAKSGTTTLEAMLYGKPMLVYYRADWLSYLIFLAFKRVKRVSWPNLLAGKDLVPELIQLDCRAQMLVKYTTDLLDVPQLRKEMEAELLSLRRQLGRGDYASNLAQEIVETFKEKGLLISEPSKS